MREYYVRAVGRGARDMWRWLGGHLRFAAFVLVATYVVGVLFGERLGGATLTRVVLVPLAALGCIVVVAFLVALARAPVMLARDALADAERMAGGREQAAVARERKASAAVPVSLLDRLRLALKRGQGFQKQTHQLALPDADFVGSVRSWHDDIYKTLVAEREPEEARRWRDETPAIPEGSRPTIGGLNSFPHVLKQQVECLEGVVSRLEARTQ
jgi:hypothetical protein